MHEGHIDKVILKGEGLIRQPSGKICFIPYVLPQEEVRYSLTRKHKDFDEGHLEEVLSAHPLRITPKCPHFGLCQGCQLQHAPIELQREMKCQWLIEQFTRTCKQTPPPLPEMDPLQSWHYRRVVDFQWQQSKEGEALLGYAGKQGELIALSTCELIQGGQKSLQYAKTFMKASGFKAARVRFIQSRKKLAVIELPDTYHLEEHLIRVKALWPYPGLDGLMLTHRFEKLLGLGAEEIEDEVHGLTISWHGLGFLQNHFEGSLAFYKWLEERMGSPGGSSFWLDLYCGVGITALMAARLGWQVKGLEISSPAIEIAKKNAARNQLTRAQFETADLNKGIKNFHFSSKKLGGILVNPPRTGIAKPLMESLCQLESSKLLYLSCDPATLCRDLKVFLDCGFHLKDWKAFDCFGQTSHFETAVWLERR
jgi:23S rRNA (uracil1939-C5)-methyltransferase